MVEWTFQPGGIHPIRSHFVKPSLPAGSPQNQSCIYNADNKSCLYHPPPPVSFLVSFKALVGEMGRYGWDVGVCMVLRDEAELVAGLRGMMVLGSPYCTMMVLGSILYNDGIGLEHIVQSFPAAKASDLT